jgi:photosystem II stability/assembly factor-like uncharacterized protein
MFSLGAAAQPWMQAPWLLVNGRQDSSNLTNFYEIQKAFKSYEQAWDASEQDSEENAGEEAEGKFPGYAQFKRWEWYMEPRVYPSGDITLPASGPKEFQKYLGSEFYKPGRSPAMTSSGNWTALGPTGTVTNGSWCGAARVNFLRFDPANSNIMWTVSPLGGLWKTTDGGLNWTNSNTDQLPITGCSDVAINPENTQIMYLATGDANATTSQLTMPSVGIFRSFDGGVTWGGNIMNWQLGWNLNIYKLLINPVDPDTVFAATTGGIYRTVNGGTNWVMMQSGQFTDIEFKPGNPNIVYAVAGIFSGGTFYKSTDAGATFVPVTSGLPLSSNVARLEIGVTPAAPDYVYVVAVKKNTWDFYGFYRSVDDGDNFTFRSSTPNILSGMAGNQAWYNLAMAVSPIHKDTLLVGATNIYRSLDGGLTWTKHTSENGGLVPFVHPDHHGLEYLPGTDSVYFSGNDGGIWKTTDRGVTWTTFNGGLQISQMYKLGTSPLDPYTIMSGHQDMATEILESGNWSVFTPNTGDGMECIYEYDNDTIVYLESYNGRIIVTYNSYPLYHVVCYNNGSGVNAPGSWITPYVMNPLYDTVLLVGKAQVYRTVNGGNSFTQVGNVTGGTTNLIALAYAPSDPNYIYAAKSNKVFVSTDGTNFTDRTGTLPVGSVSITSIAVCNTDPSKVWVTFSGYSAANKVWFSADAGVTWSSCSTGLPNLPVNCIVYQNASNDGLYVGTDIGIYFIDNSLSSWQAFLTGLPNVDVEELEIAYGIGKIRAATNGRGLWESDLAVSVPGSLTWVGGVSANWNNPLNWSPNAVPTSSQDVVIPAVTAPNHYPVVNVAGLACKNMTVNMDAAATIPAGKTFRVAGNLELKSASKLSRNGNLIVQGIPYEAAAQ